MIKVMLIVFIIVQVVKLQKNKKYINESPKKLLTVLCTPLGYMVTGYIRKRSIGGTLVDLPIFLDN